MNFKLLPLLTTIDKAGLYSARLARLRANRAVTAGPELRAPPLAPAGRTRLGRPAPLASFRPRGQRPRRRGHLAPHPCGPRSRSASAQLPQGLAGPVAAVLAGCRRSRAGQGEAGQGRGRPARGAQGSGPRAGPGRASAHRSRIGSATRRGAGRRRSGAAPAGRARARARLPGLAAGSAGHGPAVLGTSAAGPPRAAFLLGFLFLHELPLAMHRALSGPGAPWQLRALAGGKSRFTSR